MITKRKNWYVVHLWALNDKRLLVILFPENKSAENRKHCICRTDPGEPIAGFPVYGLSALFGDIKINHTCMYVHNVLHMKRSAKYIIKDNIAVYGISENRETTLNSTSLNTVRGKVLEGFPVIRRIDEDIGLSSVVRIFI